MNLLDTRCGHWIGGARRYCHSPNGVRPYLQGPRCPDHTPAALAGRPEAPSTPIHTPERSAMPDTSALVIPALTYAGRGWPVFMLARSKRPVANCPDCPTDAAGHDREACPCLTCHGFYAASTDPDRVTAIVTTVPTGQLALRTGAPSGTVVIDVDPAHGGRDTMNALIADGLLPPTAYVVTGSGGLHLYYRHPGQPISCSQGKPGQGLGPGVDVKADGGYVVLPPSVHPRTGRPYRWAPNRDMQEMPPALVTACQPVTPAPPPTLPHSPTTIRAAGGISCPDRLLAAHLDAVASATEGARRTTLYGAARGVARMVKVDAISRDDAIAALTDAGRQAEQTDRDIRAAIRGGFRAEGLAA
ncbi:Bifunctional DNA primase/polymerase, N-terminal [Micromonospora peucetia]|uniref:Bifunctional DNA primase/polymerase, N-terminal n=2 Tax=Micromonospora peucetia TaxID=47871 RepID=A0A1C6VL95_9ACTN|nr:Bifunctional DNA primase/polymerase, N-terminal [Micromonospora peucetia]